MTKADVIQPSKIEYLNGRWCLMVMGPFGFIIQAEYRAKQNAEAALKEWRRFERAQRLRAASGESIMRDARKELQGAFRESAPKNSFCGDRETAVFLRWWGRDRETAVRNVLAEREWRAKMARLKARRERTLPLPQTIVEWLGCALGAALIVAMFWALEIARLIYRALLEG